MKNNKRLSLRARFCERSNLQIGIKIASQNRALITALFFIFFFSSCEKDFVVKEQSASKGMVINSLFTDAWTISVYLSTSYSSSGSNNIQGVTGARASCMRPVDWNLRRRRRDGSMIADRPMTPATKG